MDNVHCRGGEVAAVKYRYGVLRSHVVGLHEVAAFFSAHEQLAEIPICTVLVSEEIRDKLCR